ncbi:2341_t:CDS:2, partial [Gigaspora rosea]
VPLPKFPPIIVALILAGNDDSEKIFTLHQKLLDIVADFEIHIISIGSDGAAVEFQAQNLLQATKTRNRVQYRNIQFGINFNCPVFPGIGPVIRIQDPKHGKKTARNAAMLGARLLTFGNSIVRFDQLLKLSHQENSIIYKRDIIRLDRQDDNAAYRVFCSKNLAQVLDERKTLSFELRGLFIYLFVMGELIDSYLNRNITHYERIEMVMTTYFFLHLWKYHVETLSTIYPSYISVFKNFLSMQTFNIMISLVEFLVLLVKIHRDYYEDIHLLPWKHEILQIVPKIGQYFRTVQSD